VHDSKLLHCAVCNTTLMGAIQFEAHNKGRKHLKLTLAATQNNGAIYRCLDCNKSFITRLDLQRHMENKHKGAEAEEIISTEPRILTVDGSVVVASPSIPVSIPSSISIPQTSTQDSLSEVRSSAPISVDFPQGMGPRPHRLGPNKNKKKRKGPGGDPRSSREGPTSASVKSSLECKLCNATFTGEIQKQQHLDGKKHKLKEAGESYRGGFQGGGRKRKLPGGGGPMSSPQPFFESEVPPPVGGAYSGGYSPEPLPPRRNLSPRGRGGRGRGGRGRGGGRLSGDRGDDGRRVGGYGRGGGGGYGRGGGGGGARGPPRNYRSPYRSEQPPYDPQYPDPPYNPYPSYSSYSSSYHRPSYSSLPYDSSYPSSNYAPGYT